MTEDDGWPRPPDWLVKSQRINLARANQATIHLARRLQIIAAEREEGGYDGLKAGLDSELGGPFAPAPLYLEMALTLAKRKDLVEYLLIALEPFR